MSHSRRWLLRAIIVSSALTAIAAPTLVATPHAAAVPAPAAVPNRVLSMTFNDVTFAGSKTRFVNGGTAALSIALATINGGTIREGVGRARSANKAVRTPVFNPTADGPRAVIRVVDRVGVDNLNPGGGSFTFGADFVRDANSERARSNDNGDNLIQRGLFDNRSQYKIQVDHGRLSCRIKGGQGVVTVTSPVPISAGRWYRARCTRAGTTVTLIVTRWTASGGAVSAATKRSGVIGSLTPVASTVPLSIGGKLAANGRVLDTTDQFNGRIDNSIVHIG